MPGRTLSLAQKFVQVLLFRDRQFDNIFIPAHRRLHRQGLRQSKITVTLMFS